MCECVCVELKSGSSGKLRGSGERHKTAGVAIAVGPGNNVERAMRKLKRRMIDEGIMRDLKAHQLFVKPSRQRRIEVSDAAHRKWKRGLRSKLGWIMRQRGRGF